MKKAVITTGSKQYLVSKDDIIEVDLLNTDKKTVSFEPLLIIEDKKVSIGTPRVESSKVLAEVIESDLKADKVTSIRYKAKKRVRKVHGHRQRHAKIKITQIS